jgi:hypothetical protein
LLPQNRCDAEAALDRLIAPFDSISLRPLRNPANQGLPPHVAALRRLRGNAATPSPAMNSRRRISALQRFLGKPIAIGEALELLPGDAGGEIVDA